MEASTNPIIDPLAAVSIFSSVGSITNWMGLWERKTGFIDRKTDLWGQFINQYLTVVLLISWQQKPVNNTANTSINQSINHYLSTINPIPQLTTTTTTTTIKIHLNTNKNTPML